MNVPDEKELVAFLQKDDKEAFEKLFYLFHKQVYAFACNILPTADDAEEIVQNVFLAIWNQRRTLQISGSFLSYLFGITRHLVCGLIQQRIQHEAFVEYFLEHNKNYDFITEDEVLFRELSDLIGKAIQELPERRREIFILSRIEGLNYEEITKRLGITENTVDTQIRHALDYLRLRISSYRPA